MSERIPALGSLRDRVQIMLVRSQDDGAGGHVKIQTLSAKVWARIRMRTATFGIASDARDSRIKYAAILRYRKDLMPGDMLIWDDKTLEIISIEDLNGQKAYVYALCQASDVVM